MPLIATGLLLAWWKNWLGRRGWVVAIALQALLVVSAGVAIRSGEEEEERVEKVVAENLIEHHEEAAKQFAGAGAGVLLLMVLAFAMGSRKPALPLAAVATLGTLAVLALGYRTGQAGGSLVYEHGAAQAYGSASGKASPGQESGEHEHEHD